MSMKDFFLNDVEETPIAQEAAILGHLPKWLRGTYYKVGNGKYTLPSGFQMNHIFDGFAIIYQYEIDDNKIRFKSKYLNSSAYEEAIAFGKPTYPEFGTRHTPNPNKSLVSRTVSGFLPFDLSDNNYTNLFTFNNKIFVNNESYFLHQLDPNSLQSIGKVDLRKFGIQATTGHFLSDKSGAIYNYVITYKLGIFKLCVTQFTPPLPNAEKPDGDFSDFKNIKILSSITLNSLTSMSHSHSFGMTKNYFIAIKQPIKINVLKLAVKLMKGKTFMQCLKFDSTKKTKFSVTDRATGNIVKIKYHTQSFFFLHIVNTYEEDDCLVFDVITYDNIDPIMDFAICKLRADDFNPTLRGTLKRFVLPLKDFKAAKVSDNLVKMSNTSATSVKVDNEHVFSSPEILLDISALSIQINEKFKGKKYKFGYSCIVFQNHKFYKHILKLDLLTKEIKTWRSEHEVQFASEPTFIPNPEGVDEDDGIIISVLAEPNNKNSALVFLDAKSFKEIARAEFTCQVNLGNHGLFIFKK